MLLKKLSKHDGKSLLALMIALDNETSFMLYEKGERQSTAEDQSNYIELTIDRGGMIWGAFINSGAVGFLSLERGLTRRVHHCAYLVVGVLQNESGKGIGTKLLETAELWAMENEITKLELTVMTHNHKAFGLYKKMGYEVEGIKRNSVKIDGVLYDEYYMGKIVNNDH